MSNENIKTWPENMYFQAQNDEEGLSQYKDACEYLESITWCEQPDSKLDVKYIRADVAAKREKEIILYLLNQYADKPMGRTCQQTFMGLDVLKVYGEMGLEKLK